MGKTRNLFKKIRDNKGTLHAKMGSIKDRNVMDLRETVDIKKRWQEYTEELYKKKKKSFWTTKEIISKVKTQPSQWEKIIANEATDKQAISKIYKQLL